MKGERVAVTNKTKKEKDTHSCNKPTSSSFQKILGCIRVKMSPGRCLRLLPLAQTDCPPVDARPPRPASLRPLQNGRALLRHMPLKKVRRLPLPWAAWCMLYAGTGPIERTSRITRITSRLRPKIHIRGSNMQLICSFEVLN